MTNSFSNNPQFDHHRLSALGSIRPGIQEGPRLKQGRLLAPLLLSHSVVLCVMWLFGGDGTPIESFFVTVFASVIGIGVLYHIDLRDRLLAGAGIILVTAFVARIAVGISHFLLVIDPDYFLHPTEFNYLWDYEWLHESMRYLSIHWREESFLAGLPENFRTENKNAYLIAYMALLYHFTGTYPINMAVWNTLHTLYSAVIVSDLAVMCGATRKQAVLALGLVAFEPFGFISTIMWRDSFGQTAVVLGLYLVMIYRNNIWSLVIVLPIAAFLGYCHRTPYLIAMLLTSAFCYFSNRYKSSAFVLLKISAGIVLAYVVLSGPFNSIFSAAFGRYLGRNYTTFSLVDLPIRFIRGVMGPWPWYQVFDVAHPEYMVPDFFQHVFNVAIYCSIAMYLWDAGKRSVISPPLFLGVLLFLAGIQASAIHSPYVSVGTVLLVPTVCQVRGVPLQQLIIGVLVIFLLGNAAYWMLGLTNSGIGGFG